MYSICTLIGKIIMKINIYLKIIYYKIKYGKRISFGKNVYFRKRFIVSTSKDGFVRIGDNCFFNNDCSIFAHKKIVIGNSSLFGENVKIYDHDHELSAEGIETRKFKADEINIGNNVWIGTNCVILRGTRIGDKSIIGAGSVIKGVIPSDSIIIQKRENIIKKIKR